MRQVLRAEVFPCREPAQRPEIARGSKERWQTSSAQHRSGRSRREPAYNKQPVRNGDATETARKARTHARRWQGEKIERSCGKIFFIYGPQCLISIAAANLATKARCGERGGFDLACLATRARSSLVGNGKFVESYGWDAGFKGMIVVADYRHGSCAFRVESEAPTVMPEVHMDQPLNLRERTISAACSTFSLPAPAPKLSWRIPRGSVSEYRYWQRRILIQPLSVTRRSISCGRTLRVAMPEMGKDLALRRATWACSSRCTGCSMDFRVWRTDSWATAAKRPGHLWPRAHPCRPCKTYSSGLVRRSVTLGNTLGW